MYSLVLMSAMSSAPATPEFNGFFRDLFFGCGGCYGSGNGCYGGGARYSCSFRMRCRRLPLRTLRTLSSLSMRPSANRPPKSASGDSCG